MEKDEFVFVGNEHDIFLMRKFVNELFIKVSFYAVNFQQKTKSLQLHWSIDNLLIKLRLTEKLVHMLHEASEDGVLVCSKPKKF